MILQKWATTHAIAERFLTAWDVGCSTSYKVKMTSAFFIILGSYKFVKLIPLWKVPHFGGIGTHNSLALVPHVLYHLSSEATPNGVRTSHIRIDSHTRKLRKHVTWTALNLPLFNFQGRIFLWINQHSIIRIHAHHYYRYTIHHTRSIDV